MPESNTNATDGSEQVDNLFETEVVGGDAPNSEGARARTHGSGGTQEEVVVETSEVTEAVLSAAKNERIAWTKRSSMTGGFGMGLASW